MDKKFSRQYKALMLDVDGTLIVSGGGNTISTKVKETILKSHGKINVGIVTGRPLEQLIAVFDELGLQHPCAIAGGAQIVHPVSRQILWEQPIEPQDVPIVIDTIKNLKSKIWIVENTKETLFSPLMPPVKPLSIFISKIKDKQVTQIIKKLSHIPTLSLLKVVAYHEGYTGLQINHAEATKRHGLIKVAQLLNIQHEDIIGVGDGYNDFPLFQACGLRVAMENAVPELKQQADYIAPSVHNDGVAAVIEKFFPN